jgi:ureidoacrylate peracid hydrolase
VEKRLDLQLKKHGVHQLIVTGLLAHTCVESTVRFGAELGYEITMVRDATASHSDVEMHASLDVNIPNDASAIVSAEDIVASISTLSAGAPSADVNARPDDARRRQDG